MWILILTMSYLLVHHCSGIKYIDLPNSNAAENTPDKPDFRRNPKPHAFRSKGSDWIFRQSDTAPHSYYKDDEKDLDIKTKITTLVQQTLHDTERKMKSIDQLKQNNRNLAPYRMGFILSLIKKSRDVLNELFNVAVKHRDSWKALEQLKIFELIVHTNVDTTNLVRQLVELHIQYLNSTSETRAGAKKRVVLI